MRRVLFFLMSFVIITGLSGSLYAQWAQNKNAREDARYARVLQGSEDVIIDGVEEAVWAMADSVVLGYGVTNYLPSSGYVWKEGEHVPDDSANVVCKFLYKNPYIYFLFKVKDKNVGGVAWEQFDGIIMSFNGYVGYIVTDNVGTLVPKTHNLTGYDPWNFRIEHFLSFGWQWAGLSSQPAPGSQPILKGLSIVDGGGDSSLTNWTQFTTVQGGSSYDSLPDEGWISENRMRIDSMGFNVNGDVIPFSLCMWDGDGYMDSTANNNRFNKTWWGNEWNETWYYSALFIDPNVTTGSAAGAIPPPDYSIPRLREGMSVTIDGDLSEWETDNTLSIHAAYGVDAAFDTLNGTGAWASGYQQVALPDQTPPLPTVVDGAEVNYWVTYDDANLYVSAQVTDQIVTMPYASGHKDGISFFMVPRVYVNGSGIFPAKKITVNIDSLGEGQAGDDLVSLADTAGVEFKLMLGPNTTINDPNDVDDGYTVEIKIPFAAFSYPENLRDSVVFIGALVNDVDVFDDANSDYYSKTWWYKWDTGQLSPAWVALGPANLPVGVNDEAPVPLSIELFDNYPNPFNPSTTIKYSVNVISDVTLSVYNILGQTVSVMQKTNVQPGYDEFSFDGTGLSSGVYLYQLKVKNLSSSQIVNTKVNKMVLLK